MSLIARNYCVTMIPGVWALGQFDATKRFLSSQERAAIPVITHPHLLHNQSDQFLPKTDPNAEKILVSISGISLVPDRYDYELPYTCASFWWNAW